MIRVMRRVNARRIFLYTAILVAAFIGAGFVWVLYGTPIHDAHLLMLKKAYVAAHVQHPAASMLIEKKTYLGGPDTHGSKRCVYAAGEVRSAQLSKDDIKKSYEHSFVTFGGEHLPVRVLFRDERDESYELPFTVWQDELTDTRDGSNTAYIAYVATTYPYLGDPRCDD